MEQSADIEAQDHVSLAFTLSFARSASHLCNPRVAQSLAMVNHSRWWCWRLWRAGWLARARLLPSIYLLAPSNLGRFSKLNLILCLFKAQFAVITACRRIAVCTSTVDGACRSDPTAGIFSLSHSHCRTPSLSPSLSPG